MRRANAFVMGVLGLAGCLQDPAVEDDAARASEDEICVEGDCAGQALQKLLTASSCESAAAEDGQCDSIDELGEPFSGRGLRIRGGHQVVTQERDPSGALVDRVLETRWDRIRTCLPHPSFCQVNLYTNLYFEGVTVDDVLGYLYGDWRRFWRNSAISVNATVFPGSVDQVTVLTQRDTDATPYQPIQYMFHPLAPLRDQVGVGMTLDEPELDGLDPLPNLTDGAPRAVWDVRVPILMHGPDFTGPMSILLAQDGDRVLFREVWDHMQITGAVAPLPHVAAILHAWAGSSRTPRFLVGHDSFGMDGHSGWVGLADALEEGIHPPAGQRPYPGRIRETPGDEHVAEWRSVATGEICSWPHFAGCAWTIRGSSTLDVDAPPDRVVAALAGDLGCVWRHGRVEGWQRHPDGWSEAEPSVGYRSYHLVPLVIPGSDLTLAQVDERMRDPRPLPDGGAWLDVQLQGPDFIGPAHFEVHPDGEGSRVIARFDAVRPQGQYAGIRPYLADNTGLASKAPRLSMRIHALVQQGMMPLALGGSGLVGLLNLVERGEPADGDPACLGANAE